MPSPAYQLPLFTVTVNMPAAGASQKLFGPASSPTVAAATLYSNCSTIIIQNLDTTNAIWIQATGDIPPFALALANSLVVPASSAVTIQWGASGIRPDPEETGFTLWAQMAAGAGGNVLNLTEIMGSGSLRPGN